MRSRGTRRSGLPEGLGVTIRRELARLGDDGTLADLCAAWPEVVGEAIARNAWPSRLARDGSLVVHTSSSAWAFELGQLEGVVRERLGALAPRRLKFVVGPLCVPGAETATEASTKPPQPTELEQAEGERIAREIGDPTLRELVARAAARALAAGSTDRPF